MKRKNIEDFYKPLKITKDIVKLDNIEQKNIECTPKGESMNIVYKTDKAKIDAFQMIMKTPQRSLKNNLHLEYIGFQNSRHKWRYRFEFAADAEYKSKEHSLKLNATDINSVI